MATKNHWYQEPVSDEDPGAFGCLDHPTFDSTFPFDGFEEGETVDSTLTHQYEIGYMHHTAVAGEECPELLCNTPYLLRHPDSDSLTCCEFVQNRESGETVLRVSVKCMVAHTKGPEDLGGFTLTFGDSFPHADLCLSGENGVLYDGCDYLYRGINRTTPLNCEPEPSDTGIGAGGYNGNDSLEHADVRAQCHPSHPLGFGILFVVLCLTYLHLQ